MMINDNQSQASECVNYDSTNKTINVICGSYNLSQIKQIVGTEVLSNNGKTWLLSANFQIGNFSTVFINSTDVDWLQIKGDSKEEYYGIINQGTLIVDNTKISSWNTETNDFVPQIEDGSIKRPFITSFFPQGPMNITESEISHLGFHKSPAQGISYQFSGKSKIDKNEIHNLWYGFYSRDSNNIDITNNHFHHNFKYGIDPHTNTNNLLIQNNTVHDTKVGIGIICSADCYNITIENNTVYNNKKAGIMFSQNMTNSTARNNLIYDELEAISVSESYHNEVYGNIIKNSTIGVHIKLLSPLEYNSNLKNKIYNNTISGAFTAIKVDPDVSSNSIYENTITDSRYGIWISNITRTNNSIYDNSLAENKYAIWTIILNDKPQNEFEDLETIWCNNEINYFAEKGFQLLTTNIEITEAEKSSMLTITVPPWVKNNVCWWSDGLISDKEFELGIEYLTNQGILWIKTDKDQPLIEITISPPDEIKSLQPEDITDNNIPSIKITNPSPDEITNYVGTIVIEGTAFDESGIAKVEAFAHTLPRDGKSNYEYANPTSTDDWSKWSIELTIPDEQTYRVIARVTDKTGNQNWVDILINMPLNN